MVNTHRSNAGEKRVSVKGLDLLELNLTPTILESQVRTLLVVAPYEGNGATTATLSLAQALNTHLGESVLVIDGNHKAPRLHEQFNLPLTPGFLTLVEDYPSADVCIGRSQDCGFDVMPAGRARMNHTVSDLRERMRAILDVLCERYKYILFDGMAVQTHPEVFAVAPIFDGVVLVLECEETPWSIGVAIKDKLERSGAVLISAILNKRELHIPKRIYNAL